jgi:hypothetical protein
MRQAKQRYNLSMPVFDEKQEELEHYETMMGVPRGRLAVTMDMITDAMALVGQHGVYCLPEPALAGQAGDGYPDGHEEFDGREGADSERDGETEGGLIWGGAGTRAKLQQCRCDMPRFYRRTARLIHWPASRCHAAYPWLTRDAVE